MIALRKTAKTAPPDFAAAREKWERAETAWQELLARAEGMKLALSLAKSPGDSDRVSPKLKALAAPYLELAEDKPSGLIKRLRATEAALDRGLDGYRAEREAWQAAQRRRTDEIALTLQDRHRAAAQKIGAALELLAAGLASEREIHAELRRTAPLDASRHLPDLHTELEDACLSNWGSAAWRWRRLVGKLNILD